jgi:hypothetical protein
MSPAIVDGSKEKKCDRLGVWRGHGRPRRPAPLAIVGLLYAERRIDPQMDGGRRPSPKRLVAQI